MAYTQTQLDNLKTHYAAGLTNVRDSDGRSISYASLDDLWNAIQRIESSLNRGTRRPYGVIRFRRPS